MISYADMRMSTSVQGWKIKKMPCSAVRKSQDILAPAKLIKEESLDLDDLSQDFSDNKNNSIGQ